jgi:putative flippase GtrA
MKTPAFIATFSKAQASAFSGGIVDYLVMLFLTEVLHFHYTISIAIGGVIGAFVNFSLNKNWTFRSRDIPYTHSANIQSFRFVLVVINSIVMKDLGTYIITNQLQLDYKISRIIVDLFVSLAFNFTLQKYWVFKKQCNEIQ